VLRGKAREKEAGSGTARPRGNKKRGGSDKRDVVGKGGPTSDEDPAVSGTGGTWHRSTRGGNRGRRR
jgi:hypothetical protein